MAKRKISNYLLMSKNANASVRYSANDRKGKFRKPKPTVAFKMSEFLTNNVFAWFIHNWRIRKRRGYPVAAGNSLHYIPMGGRTTPFSLCIAADWASGTPQAAYIGGLIAGQRADYTLHLGDTYFSGRPEELVDNFGDGTGHNRDGLWPRGRAGSFALLGNHEMYSSGGDFLAMIENPLRRFGTYDAASQKFSGQPAPFFCLVFDHWVVLALDTGYDSLQKNWLKRILNKHPNDLNMQLTDVQMQWLKANPDIFDRKRGLVLLSHHQYASGFKGEDEFVGPARQLRPFIGDREILWIWGHEHRFALYNRYAVADGTGITVHGRCIGHGGMIDEHLDDRMIDPEKATSRGLRLYDLREADSFHFNDKTIKVGPNGFAQMTIDGEQLTVTYRQAYWNGERRTKEYDEAIFTEVWRPDVVSGNVVLVSEKDLTINPVTGVSALNHWPAIYTAGM